MSAVFRVREYVTVDGVCPYRQWLETQSAVGKAPDPEAARALKVACLLGLGSRAGRSKCDRGQLIQVVSGYGPKGPATRVVDDLIKRRLLLHREHSGEVSVWHGTDVDLRGRHVVLIDDVASTGRTLAEASGIALARGATRVDAMVVHPLFVPGAEAVLEKAGISEVWSTDSITHMSNTIRLAPLLAEGLRSL